MTPADPTARHLAFCLFAYFPHGGLQRDMLRIAMTCHERGHRVTVLTGRWQGPIPEGLHVTLLPVSGFSNHARAASFARALQRAREETAYDTVIGFNKVPGLDLYYAADDCFAARADHRGLRAWLPRVRQYGRLERAVFGPESETRILVLTRRQREAYRDCYGTPPERFVLLPPNLDPARACPADSEAVRRRLRSDLTVAAADVLILLVGSAWRTKGLDRALAALAAHGSTPPGDLVLAVAGPGDVRTWQRRARRLGVDGRVRFLGPREDILDLMVAADLLLHPSRRDSAGIVLLEALVAGLPTIVTGCCGYADHVRAADSGWVLPEPFRQEALDRCLAEALNAEARATRRGRALAYAARTDLSGMVDAAVAAIEAVGSGRPTGTTGEGV